MSTYIVAGYVPAKEYLDDICRYNYCKAILVEASDRIEAGRQAKKQLCKAAAFTTLTPLEYVGFMTLVDKYLDEGDEEVKEMTEELLGCTDAGWSVACTLRDKEKEVRKVLGYE